MSAPRVTIGLPVYNGERYLAETMDSLLVQDFTDFELLVADNASTDGTLRIVQERAERDPRVRLLRSQRNMGAAYNYNRLVRESQTELFKWAGYDDLLDPAYLSQCVKALDEDATAVLAFPQTGIIDADGQYVRDYDDRLDLSDQRAWQRVATYAWRVSLCNACFGVLRRDVMLTTGLIRPYVSSDVTFLAEMAARGTFLRLPDRLFLRRVHVGSSRQGRTTMAEIARWFDTSATRTPRAPRLRMAAGTTRALATGPGDATERTATAAAFASVYATRRLRIRAGRARATLAGRRLRPPELIHHLSGSNQ